MMHVMTHDDTQPYLPVDVLVKHWEPLHGSPGVGGLPAGHVEVGGFLHVRHLLRVWA